MRGPGGGANWVAGVVILTSRNDINQGYRRRDSSAKDMTQESEVRLIDENL